MREQTADSKSNAEAAPATQTNAAVQPAPVSMAQAMIARGQHDPNAFASLMQTHPQIKAEIVMLLQQTLGNSFVQAVLSVVARNVTSGLVAAVPSSGGETGPMRVTAHGLHVRSSPSKTSDDNIVDTLDQHQTVKPTGRNGEWVAIEHAKPAFVFGQYLEPVAKPGAAHKTPAPIASSSAVAESAPAPIEPATTAVAAPASIAPATAAVAAPAPTTAAAAAPVPSVTSAAAAVHGAPAPIAPIAPVAALTTDPVAVAGPAHGTIAQPEADAAHVAKEHHAKEQHGKEHKPKAQKATRYTQYGGGRVKTVLAKLVQEDKLKATAHQIAQMDALSNVETGGQIAAVDTTDDEVVSIGFHQIVYGSLSIQKVMQMVPEAFKKHGLELDTSKKYDFKSSPFQIVGAPDYEVLRTREWGSKFYAASAEPDVIVAIAKFVLAEMAQVETIATDAGAKNDFFNDDTARAWLLEFHNSRPAWADEGVKRAIAKNANGAKTREQFLDILSEALIEVYTEKEPRRAYKAAKKEVLANAKKHHTVFTPEEDAALLAHITEKYTEIGRTKASHIVTKIPRHIEVPTLEAPTAAGKDTAMPTAMPTATPATATPAALPVAKTDDHDEHHDVRPPAEHHTAKPPHAHHDKRVEKRAATPVVAPAAGAPPALENHDAKLAPTPIATSAIEHHDAQHDSKPAPAQVASTPEVTQHPEVTKQPPEATKQPSETMPATAFEAPTGSKDMVSLVVKAGGQYVQVYVSPGGINHTPDIFMFFHGYYANLGIDPHTMGKHAKGNDNASGEDSAATAMAQAKAHNTIAMLPQGVHGDGSNSGGAMSALKPTDKKEKDAFPKFLDEILMKIAAELGRDGTLKPHHIGLAGHSAGGYEGIHDALAQSGTYSDTITDLTLMDSSYSTSHFAEASKWMFAGSHNKTVRIVQSPDQIENSYHKVKNENDPKHATTVRIDPFWRAYFGESQLKGAAATHKMTIKKLGVTGDDRGNNTKAIQHTQIIAADGSVHCDVLVLQSALGHHEIRDNVMDDAMSSIGQGAAGADDFGKNHIENYGRDVSMPHYGDSGPQKAAKAPTKKPDKHAAVPTPAPTSTQETPNTAATTVNLPAPAHADPKPDPQKLDHHAVASRVVAAPTPTAKHHDDKQIKQKHAAEPETAAPLNAVSQSADLTELSALVASVNNPAITSCMHHLSSLATLQTENFVGVKGNSELKGAHRNELVKGIGEVHAEVKALTADMDPTKLTAIKSAMFRALQEISPYHAQARNINILEGKATRTCSVTSLGMALEGLGKGVATYQGDKQGLLAVAKVYSAELGEAEVKGENDASAADWGRMAALRLPDFLELAAIAHIAGGATDTASIKAAAAIAWKRIKQISFLGKLAKDFGATATLKHFTTSADPAPKEKHAQSHSSTVLEGQGLEQRHRIDKVIDARNKMEAENDPTKKAALKQAYDRLHDHDAAALNGNSIEKSLPVEEYKQSVISQLGAELASGAAIETHVINHFIRLHSVHEDHVVIDDPSQDARAHKKVLWEEARAQGMFEKRLVIT